MKLEVAVFIDHLLSKTKKDKENTILPDTRSGIAKAGLKFMIILMNFQEPLKNWQEIKTFLPCYFNCSLLLGSVS